jgi:hypothetical protein
VAVYFLTMRSLLRRATCDKERQESLKESWLVRRVVVKMKVKAVVSPV